MSCLLEENRFVDIRAKLPKILCAAMILLAVGAVLLAGIQTRAARTPLSVGENVDKAWTYLHSTTARRSRGPLFDVAFRNWKADVRSVQFDQMYYPHWQTNRVVATRHVVCLYNTNGLITHKYAHWKFGR